VRLTVDLGSGITSRCAGIAAQHVRTIAHHAHISTAVSVFAVTLLAAGALISVPATAAAATGPGDFLTIVSQPGDIVGQGQSYSYTQSNATFRLVGGGTLIQVYGGDTWLVQLGAPNGGRLQVRTYTGATSALVGNDPYIFITGTGLGCNTTGSFTVLAVAYDQSGFLLSLHATFQQTCVGATAGLSGEVFFFAPPVVIPGQNVAYAGGSRSFDLGAFADGNASAASPWSVNVSWGDGTSSAFSTTSQGNLGTRAHTYPTGVTTTYHPTVRVTNAPGATSYATFNVKITTSTTTPTASFMYNSQPNESIAHGGTATYTNSNALFQMSGSTDTWIVELWPSSGSGMWNISLTVPAGSQLVPGTYLWASTYPVATTVPGLAVSGNSTGCDSVSGAFRVLRATYDSSGFPTSLDATFVQHCDYEPAALTGEVIYTRPASTTPKAKAAAHQAFSRLAQPGNVAIGSFTDAAGSSDAPWRVNVAWGDGSSDAWSVNSTGSLGSRTHTFAVGVWQPVVSVENNANLTGSSTDLVAVYDPARSLTGSGTIASIAGACTLSSACSVAGTGTFSMSSKYPSGATKPAVSFSFSAPSFSFAASNPGWWLVGWAGSKAILQGNARVNGTSGFTYRLAVTDGSTDRLEFQVWNSVHTLVYDNGSSEALSKGSLSVK
jgi:hypothetical protein